MLLPAARQPPQLGGPVIYNVPTPATRCPQRLKRRKRILVAESGTMDEKIAENFAESGDFHMS